MARPGRISFAALLRRILVTEQNRKLKDVAAQIGLSPRNFYGRVVGRIQFTPDEINRVLRVVPDPRLGDWLLANSGLACTRSIAPSPADAAAPALNFALNGVEESMAALRSVLHMRPPAEITAAGIEEAETHIEAAQRELAALLLALRASQPRATSRTIASTEAA